MIVQHAGGKSIGDFTHVSNRLGHFLSCCRLHQSFMWIDSKDRLCDMWPHQLIWHAGDMAACQSVVCVKMVFESFSKGLRKKKNHLNP